MEAEYVAATNLLKDVIWLQNLISEICAPIVGPTIILCNNQGTITLTQNNKFHPRTKHIDIQYHFIQKAVNDEDYTHILSNKCQCHRRFHKGACAFESSEVC